MIEILLLCVIGIANVITLGFIATITLDLKYIYNKLNNNENCLNYRNKNRPSIVLEHLLEYKSITPKEALENYGIYRLGGIIHTLRKSGYNIKTEFVNIEFIPGQVRRCARYTLIKESE